jgi:transcription antitermination factor NusG
MNLFRTGWYLIYTKPRHEKKVFSHLTELKINSFLPTRRTLRTWHDRKKYVDEPFFPSYVFIYLEDMKTYYEGMEADGALYYVRTGKEITRVQDSIVNNIKLIADRGKGVEITGSELEPGRKMIISKGPLTGLSCELVRYNNKEMLLVRVNLLQRNVLATLAVEHLMVMQ